MAPRRTLRNLSGGVTILQPATAGALPVGIRAAILPLLCAAALLAAPPALARPLPNGGVTAPEVAQVLQSLGLKVTEARDSDGDPMLRSRDGDMEFGIYFYQCPKPAGAAPVRCPSIQFVTMRGSPPNPQAGATWNRTRRFARAYQTPDHSVYVELDAELSHGATTELITRLVYLWSGVLVDFRKTFP